VADDTDTLSKEDNLIVTVACTTCFMFRVDPASTPRSDVENYVSHLVKLYALHLLAKVNFSDSARQDMRSTVGFCASQIESAAPELRFSIVDLLIGAYV